MKKEHMIPIFSGLLLFLLFALSLLGFYLKARKTTAAIIADDIARLTTIFNTIHTTCSIISFDEQQNVINFLNVGNFTGSEIGSMNLTYPHKWEGPYLENNLTMQEKEYMIVHTNNGYFITPGNGVTLPNGKTIGTDLIFDKSSDIAALINDGTLRYKKKPLAAQIAL